MDRLLFACLALVVVARVQSYTLRDALRDRELNRLRAFDMYDSNRVSDEEKFRVLNRLREFHLSRLFDEEKGENEGCKDVHADCHMMNEIHCKEEKNKGIKAFIEEYCRATCNVDNCNPKGESKQPAPGLPTCKDDLPNKECRSHVNLCGDRDLIGRYLFKYCSETCVESCKTNHGGGY